MYVSLVLPRIANGHRPLPHRPLPVRPPLLNRFANVTVRIVSSCAQNVRYLFTIRLLSSLSASFENEHVSYYICLCLYHSANNPVRVRVACPSLSCFLLPSS